MESRQHCVTFSFTLAVKISKKK